MKSLLIKPYTLAVGVLLVVGSPILSTVASTQIAERNATKLQRQAAANQEEQREESRVRTCALFAALLDAYVETPPTTDSGRNVQATYLEFYQLNGCQPPRKK